jgi:hypothetical protein
MGKRHDMETRSCGRILDVIRFLFAFHIAAFRPSRHHPERDCFVMTALCLIVFSVLGPPVVLVAGVVMGRVR